MFDRLSFSLSPSVICWGILSLSLSLSHPLSFAEVFDCLFLSAFLSFIEDSVVYFCHLLYFTVSLTLSLSSFFFWFVFWSFLVVLNCPSLSLSDFLLFSKVFNSFPLSYFLASEQLVFFFTISHIHFCHFVNWKLWSAFTWQRQQQATEEIITLNLQYQPQEAEWVSLLKSRFSQFSNSAKSTTFVRTPMPMMAHTRENASCFECMMSSGPWPLPRSHPEWCSSIDLV